jgi:hypothetical protein
VRRAVILLAILILSAAADAPTVHDLNRAFVAEHEQWAAMWNARIGATGGERLLSAAEVLEWQRVKSAWRALEKRVDSEYRGEK